MGIIFTDIYGKKYETLKQISNEYNLVYKTLTSRKARYANLPLEEVIEKYIIDINPNYKKAKDAIEEEKRIAEEKRKEIERRIAEEKRKEIEKRREIERRIAEEKRREAERIAEGYRKEEKRIAEEKHKEALKALKGKIEKTGKKPELDPSNMFYNNVTKYYDGEILLAEYRSVIRQHLNDSEKMSVINNDYISALKFLDDLNVYNTTGLPNF